MQLSLSNGKDAKSIDRDACIEVASIESTCIRDTCTSKNTGTRDIFSTGGVFIKGIFVGVACTENSYARGANAFKHLGIYLQFF